jgi:hypothetical protein
VAVFQTRASGGKEGFNEFRFAEFAKESEGISTDVLVGVLKIVANTVAVEIGLLDKESQVAMARGILTKPRSSPA